MLFLYTEAKATSIPKHKASGLIDIWADINVFQREEDDPIDSLIFWLTNVRSCKLYAVPVYRR